MDVMNLPPGLCAVLYCIGVVLVPNIKRASSHNCWEAVNKKLRTCISELYPGYGRVLRRYRPELFFYCDELKERGKHDTLVLLPQSVCWHFSGIQ